MIRRALLIVAVGVFATLGFAGTAGAATLDAAVVRANADSVGAAVRANTAGLSAGATTLGATFRANEAAFRGALQS